MSVKEWLLKNYCSVSFYVFFLMTLFTFNIASDNYDYDFWARLIVGKHFVQTGKFLTRDFLSYTPTHTWYDHEWGSGVVFYIVQHLFSHIGLVILQFTILALIYVMIVQMVKLRGVKTTHPYNFLFYFFSAWALMHLYYQPFRCQLFSFLFFTFFLYALELAKKGENRLLFAIPVVMIIWNNMHGGCVSGLGLIVFYIIGEFINRKPVKKYFLVLFLSILVLPINPMGFDYIVYLLQANTMQRAHILEWENLFIPSYKYIFLEFKYFVSVMLLSEIGYLIYAFKTKTFKFDATKYIVLVVTFLLALEHIKLIPFCVISMSVFLYDDFYTLFNFITLGAINKMALLKDCIVYLAALYFIISSNCKYDFQPFLTFNKFPVLETEFLRINNMKGKLLTNYEQGSYTSYKLYPNIKIFMDGRYEEVYGEHLKELLDKFMLNQNYGWDDLLKEYPPDYILMYRIGLTYNELLHHPEWTQVYTDGVFGLMVRTSELRKNYKLPSTDINYYKKRMFDTSINFRVKK
jgi:hypothetical protein